MSGLVFPPIPISQTKRNHMGQGLGNTGGEAKQLLFFLQKKKKRRFYCGGMRVGIVMSKTDMFKTSGRASFLIIFFSVSSVLRLCSTFG